MRFPLLRRLCPFACALLLPWLALAQPAGTGTITGRVFNPASGEYVRNANVRVDGTNLSVTSEDGGLYRISGVAPGNATVVVTYTGYQPTTAIVNVAPGGT